GVPWACDVDSIARPAVRGSCTRCTRASSRPATSASASWSANYSTAHRAHVRGHWCALLVECPPDRTANRTRKGPPMTALKVIAAVLTLLWLVGVLTIGLLWMVQEYSLIVKDNGDGTYTFRDGPDLDTSTKGEFLAVALKNTLQVVLYFPTLPYLTVMTVL